MADRPRTVTTTEREPPPTHREHLLPTGKLPMSKDLGVPPIVGGARVPGVRGARPMVATRVGPRHGSSSVEVDSSGARGV